MNSIELTARQAASRQELEKMAGKIARLPVIRTKKEAGVFKEGLEKIASISEKDLERIGDLTTEELAKEKGIDVSIVKAVDIVNTALKSVSDFLTKTPNPFLEKAFHNETSANMENYVTMVSMMEDVQDSQHMDMGWMSAFNSVNAGGTAAVKVRDLVHNVRFYQLGHDEDAKLTSIGGGPVDDMVGPDRFGGGVKINDWDSQFSLFNANAILANMRIASMRLYNWCGYKELCLIQDANKKQTYSETLSAATGADDLAKHKIKVQNMVSTLNNAYLKLILEASQAPTNPGSGYPQNKTEARIPVSASTPVLVYYNIQHEVLMRQVMEYGFNKSFNGDGLLEGLAYPFVFVPSLLVPKSGAYRYKSNAKDNEIYDAWGAKGPVDEYDSQGGVGVQMVIPDTGT